MTATLTPTMVGRLLGASQSRIWSGDRVATQTRATTDGSPMTTTATMTASIVERSSC